MRLQRLIVKWGLYNMTTVASLLGLKGPEVYKSKLKATTCTNPDLICGVELEVENAHPDSFEYSDNLSNAWAVERDGSLRGGNTAYEFISRPLPLGTLLPELGEFFRKTKFSAANYSDRCSIHVHTNVTDFTQDMLASLAMVYSVVEDVLFQYINYHDAVTPDGYSRDTNLYCIPWSQCRMNYRLIEKMFQTNQKPFHRWQKYTALNLLPITTQGTVEWRHMHGTADMGKITTWLNIIASIMDYAKKTPLDKVIMTVRSLNDTSAYRQFFLDVLKGHLEYDDKYAPVLSEGVVNAKYSLQDWDKSKIKEAKSAATDDGFSELEARLAEIRVQQREQILRATRTIRTNTNPAPPRATTRVAAAPPEALDAWLDEEIADREDDEEGND